MPAATLLDTSRLLAELAKGPAAPSPLAKTLGVSRSTVHRRLVGLLEAGLVRKLGAGPSARYERKSAEELATPPALEGYRVSMHMGEKTAAVVQRALEFYARIGTGQLEEVLDLARAGVLKRRDGSEASFEELEEARRHLEAAKRALTGLHANASHGIHSPNVGPDVKDAWAAQTALRHRMAWDREPRGGMGVYFDEPLHAGREPVTVESGTEGPLQAAASQLPPDALLQCSNGTWRVLVPHADGEHLRVLAESGSWQTAIAMAKNVLEGRSARSCGL